MPVYSLLLYDVFIRNRSKLPERDDSTKQFGNKIKDVKKTWHCLLKKTVYKKSTIDFRFFHIIFVDFDHSFQRCINLNLNLLLSYLRHLRVLQHFLPNGYKLYVHPLFIFVHFVADVASTL